MATAQPTLRSPASSRAQPWILFVHQLPSAESNLRVRIWRRLQQIGALALKQAIYVLPDSPVAREDFEWLRREVIDGGGQALVFSASGIDLDTDDGLVQEFRAVRRQVYQELADEAESVLRAHERWQRRKRGKAPDVARARDTLRQRFLLNQRLDLFGSGGRQEAAEGIARLDALGEPVKRSASSSSRTVLDPAAYRGRLWVTRPRPGVDRMSSAWLIRRFIDPEARFAFRSDLGGVPADAVPFDMYGGTFTHVGDLCTFEYLSEAFGIRDAAVTRVASIVHDLDVKDARFGVPDAVMVSTLIDGLQRAHPEDDVLLAQGMALFEALYRGSEASAEADRPATRAKAAPKRGLRR